MAETETKPSADDEPPLLRIPEHFRHPSDVLATAAKLDLPNIVALSTNGEGLLILHAGKGAPLTEAQILWLLEKAKLAILNRSWMNTTTPDWANEPA